MIIFIEHGHAIVLTGTLQHQHAQASPWLSLTVCMLAAAHSGDWSLVSTRPPICISLLGHSTRTFRGSVLLCTLYVYVTTRYIPFVEMYMLRLQHTPYRFLFLVSVLYSIKKTKKTASTGKASASWRCYPELSVPPPQAYRMLSY